MAPSRSKKSKYKKKPRAKAISPHKDEDSMSKTKQRKRKLSDMLGPQWSKEELERFYEGYRKFGKEWKKVAAFVHSRSAEMVEALYTMNKAYLSLPEGTASVVGLNAMMTDHYSVLHGGSDSEQENNEGIETPRSSSGFMPSLKKRRTETVPRAVGKRTPRIPISYTLEKDTRERYLSPVKRGLNQKGDDTDDDMEHEIALALAEASQRGGSTKNSHTPNRKAKMYPPDKKGERMRADIDLAIAKLHATDMEDVRCEPSLGSTEADNGDYSGGRNDLMHGEGSSAVEKQQKGRTYYRRRLGIKEEDAKEACSGTDEAPSLGAPDEKFEPERDGKSLKFTYKVSRRKSKKSLFTADEDTACDALQTLADLSLMMPETATDTESSVQAEEKRAGKAYVSDFKGTDPASMSKSSSLRNSKQRRSGTNDLCDTEPERKSPSSSLIRKRRQKVLPAKLQVLKDELAASSKVIEPCNNKGIGEENKPVGRGKRSASIRNSHEKKSVKPHDRTSSSNNIVEEDESAPSNAVIKKQVNLPTKVRSRRKIVTEKPLTIDDGKISETLEKFSHYTSSFRARRWCLFEWFYSAIDYPWFARQEFVEYLDHVGLGHVPRLTRVEWGVIRSSLGKPRRFSEQFLKEEKEKLYLYRDSVRKHYDELNTGMREGLPMDLARPLNVSQRVISLHPKSREIHDGSVLTVDHCRYRIQFDHPELGVEFVKDTECMPLNPLENMPASLARHYAFSNYNIQNPVEEKMHERAKESMLEGYSKLSCETGRLLPSPNYNVSNSLKQEKVDISSSNPQAQDGVDEALDLQLFNSQPSSIGHIQAREADVQALSELTRALDKKELVLRELKCMNDEVVESQKDGHNALKDSESFKKQYAAVLFQLSEINEQVSLALLGLRQRNTYQENVPYASTKRMNKSGEPDGQLTYVDNYVSDTNGFHVSEIVESSRIKARKMVYRAVQALALLRKDENNNVNMEEAIDFVNNQLSIDQTEGSSVQQTQGAQDQRLPSTPNPPSSTPANDSHLNPPDQNDLQIPSELVSRCMATLLMIQKCTERQFPPSEVAQVLDSAVASLQPCCSQNLPIYTEIQKCMGIIRNQILALVPS
ncbi:protein ALWAYS EARLY 3 isoform X2 [Arabidopsis lyrata subsp. lyrata]|uniref:protein ALWAYS EARLY 3 isoform X2 n=1 Tax=Arabidopsis lyrata subsp. lyrata TaxID=81972 RepID=UPI000A29DCAA|nr:protein ALWAYS EARLY 3 isoform X2 [Arabidopsis lyrata subsp. lyrata]|eukprot:XP_020887226.1 protein ALWAYS EARLY 3 isoform X2 [Arabidopsis lyrata subsp. lyrata]